VAETDYIVVGAGSAGSALAYRLAEAGQHRITLVEHGGTDIGPFIQMPSALSYPMNMSLYDWGFRTEPEPHLGGRRLATPRGKVIGGSSSINGMVYVRGHAEDFDTWEAMGAEGWGYRHVLPYFRRQETAHGGENGWRGDRGPMHVHRGPMRNPLYKAFIEAGRQAGYGVTDDYNGHRQEGFGAMEMTVHDGRRWSVANAYLRPAFKTGRVRIVRALARRVVFEGRRAIGVEVEHGGRIQVLRARRDIVISASAINSPKLLKLSGVGPGSELQRFGIPVVADRPGVGENLQDHLEVYVQAACKQPITLNKHMNVISKGLIGLRWLLFKTGLGATNHFESCGFIRSAAGIKYPDIQYHFLPAAVRYDGRAAVKGHGFQVHVGPMRSKSRGNIRLKSADPKAPPAIQFNYMSHADDWREFRSCIRLTRELFRQPAMAPYYDYEIQPGAQADTDEEIDQFIKEHVESAYHPCGTCRMGAADDPTAVVDPECRVIGVDNLRVADSSIFPLVTNGNLNAPSIMTGEKAADHILGRETLPASNQTPWIHPQWQTMQR
jgi:choline dehydrogenase